MESVNESNASTHTPSMSTPASSLISPTPSVTSSASSSSRQPKRARTDQLLLGAWTSSSRSASSVSRAVPIVTLRLPDPANVDVEARESVLRASNNFYKEIDRRHFSSDPNNKPVLDDFIPMSQTIRCALAKDARDQLDTVKAISSFDLADVRRKCVS